jgi:hypothetical protein
MFCFLRTIIIKHRQSLALKLKAHFPVQYNLHFNLHFVKTSRQLIVSLSVPVLGVILKSGIFHTVA